MPAGLADLMAELDRAGLTIGQDENGVWRYLRVRAGECHLHPDVSKAIKARWADAVKWVQGLYDGEDGDSWCSLCSGWVTPLGRKDGMVFGLCDRRTEPCEFDRKAVLCPYRRQ
jgi:hypothetical protein